MLETGSPEGGVKTDRINRLWNAWELPHGKRFTLETPRRTWTLAVPVPVRIIAAGWAPGADVKGLEERCPDWLLTRFEDLEPFFRKHAADVNHQNAAL